MVEHPERKSFGEENIVGERWRVRHVVPTGIFGYMYLFGIRHVYLDIFIYSVSGIGTAMGEQVEFSPNNRFLFRCGDAHVPATHAHLVSFFGRLHCISYRISQGTIQDLSQPSLPCAAEASGDASMLKQASCVVRDVSTDPDLARDIELFLTPLLLLRGCPRPSCHRERHVCAFHAVIPEGFKCFPFSHVLERKTSPSTNV